MEDLGYDVEYEAADDYQQRDLAYCNWTRLKRHYCPEHLNTIAWTRHLRSAEEEEHRRPLRRQLSEASREIVEQFAFEELLNQRQSHANATQYVDPEASVAEEDDDEMIFVGGDLVTVYYMEEDGTIFGETVRWEQVEHRRR